MILLSELLTSIKSGTSLDSIISDLLIFSKESSNEELEKWCQLELNGYFKTNPYLTEEVKVPDYRIIYGQHKDIHGRPFIIDNPEMGFVNEYRLRQGIGELEEMALERNVLMVRDPSMIGILKNQLGVEVHQFEFTSMAVKGILNGIKSKLIDLIHNLIVTTPQTESQKMGELTTEFLHPLVKSVSEKLFLDGHYRQAILDTYIKLVEVVQTKSGRFDLDGTQLMQTVFSAKNPVISISEDADEQLGFMWLFSGAVMGIRNPKAHRLIQQTDPQRALDWLHFASVLMKVLDDSDVIKSS